MRPSSLTSHTILLGLLPALFLAACSVPGQEEGRHRFREYSEGDITIAHTTGGPKFEGELFRYERAAVMQEDEREASIIVRGEPPVMDERGWFYLPDSSPSDHPATSCIMVFDSEGTYRYSFGRPGQGPGEMIHPEILRVGEGRLELYDPYVRRFSFFTTEGGLIRVESIPGDKRLGWIRRCYHTLEGRFAVPSQEAVLGEDGYGYHVRRMVVFSAEWDTLFTLESRPEPMARLRRVPPKGPMDVSEIPFSGRSVAVYDERHGYIVASGSKSTLELYGEDGTHRRTIRVDLTPRMVTSADRDRFEAPWKERLQRARTVEEREGIEARLDVDYPEHMAWWGIDSVSDLEVDASGHFWIRIPEHVTAPDLGEGAICYHILSPQGEYLGITRLPTDRRGRTRITRGHLTVVELDEETGSREVVAYRLLPVVEGLVYP